MNNNLVRQISRYRVFMLELCVLMLGLVPGQAQTEMYALSEIEGIEVVDSFASDQGYYVFYPTSGLQKSMVPVVFIHGYGALNPMIYGKWIKYLLQNGHCVIYPRYQENILVTAPKEFVSNTSTAISNALGDIRESEIATDIDEMYLIGHSYGGVIAANIAVNWRLLHLPRPRIAFLCEPGSGPFDGGLLDGYAAMDSTLHLTIIVGDKDYTVGQKFGQSVYESAVNTPNRVLLWQYACSRDSFRVSASHYEPYALDPAFDNGIENFTTRRAGRVARLDQIDREGYWKTFDMLVTKAREKQNLRYGQVILDKFADLGIWPDGFPLCKMDCHYPEQSRSHITK